MDRQYCYLVSVSHPEGCSEDYVILNINDLSLCIKEYQQDYSVNNFYDPLEVVIKTVNLKGGLADGKSKKDAS